MGIIRKKTVYDMLRKTYGYLLNSFLCFLTYISPELNNRVRYRILFRKKLSLKNPTTFQEKLIWLKLKKYNNDPLVIQCADKFLVRQYVEKKGLADLLNELIDVYESVDEIYWERLPNQFVMKWNFGAGMNIICKDKSQLNEKEVKAQLRKWGRNKYWLPHAEMHYKYIPPKIICEKYLTDDCHDAIPDYKVYCFHGKPLAILVMLGRGSKLKTQFFDKEWKILENTAKYEVSEEKIEKPECFEKMIKSAELLSEGFPFVRCDFYVVNKQLYFGELTFMPAAGFYASETNINGKSMADYIII